MRNLFGTDGIRGIANVYPMTSEVSLQLGRALAHVFKSSNKSKHKILIGKDTRLSGYMIETAMSAGICSMGVDVMLVGPMPTPAIAFLTHSMRADAGIVISASHNPFQDNGIKIFAGNGFKLPDSQEEHLEELILSNELDHLRPTANEIGKAFRVDDATGRYIVYLKNIFPNKFTLDGIKIVVDCAHGATYKVAPAVFEELGAEVIKIGVTPNGKNINDRCGSLYPEQLSKAVIKNGAHLGVALDGDGDRAIFADEIGEIVDGDHIMAICANDLKEQGNLNANTLVATVMSNIGLEIAAERLGIFVKRTQVGDRYVVETMRTHNYNFGGEQSGHLIFLDHSSTGDGIIAALNLLSIMIRKERKLSELKQIMESLPQKMINISVKEKKPIESIPELKNFIDKVEKELDKEGRVLIRYSGTENKMRIMVEGPTNDIVEKHVNDIAEIAKKYI